MPYGMCPICGAYYHMSVGDVRAWYEEYHPTLQFGSLVAGACYYCWQELSVGTAVVIRKREADQSQVHEGEGGVIEEILTSEHGNVFLVKLDSGKEVYFIRSQLRKLRDGEVKPDKVTE